MFGKINKIIKEGVTVAFIPKSVSLDYPHLVPQGKIIRTGNSRFLKYLILEGVHDYFIPDETTAIPRMIIICRYSKNIWKIVGSYTKSLPRMMDKPWNIYSAAKSCNTCYKRFLIIIINSCDLMKELFEKEIKFNGKEYLSIELIMEKLSFLFDTWYFLSYKKKFSLSLEGFKNVLVAVFYLPESLSIKTNGKSLVKVLYSDIIREPEVRKLIVGSSERVILTQQLYVVIVSIALSIVINILKLIPIKPIKQIFAHIFHKLFIFSMFSTR